MAHPERGGHATWIRWAVSAGVGCWIGVAAAQEAPSSPCADACREAETHCLAACGQHDNPVECEAACRDAAWQCNERCGDRR